MSINLNCSSAIIFLTGVFIGTTITTWYLDRATSGKGWPGEKDGPLELHSLSTQHQHKVLLTLSDAELSMEIKKHIRIFCWIPTTGNNDYYRAINVNVTWASKCDKHIFISSTKGTGIPVVKLNITEGRPFLWMKTREAFKHIYKTELYKYDWFLKADDDTFVIIENLRFMLLAHLPEQPIYFGCKFKKHVKQGYMSGGAGYVLSREALKRFVEFGLANRTGNCKHTNRGTEDIDLGRCMQACGVVAGDSRDYMGRHRMLPLPPVAYHDASGQLFPPWYSKYMFYNYTTGIEGCSDYLISFHYIDPSRMFALYYLIYHIGRPIKSVPEPANGTELLRGEQLYQQARQKAIQYSHPLINQ